MGSVVLHALVLLLGRGPARPGGPEFDAAPIELIELPAPAQVDPLHERRIQDPPPPEPDPPSRPVSPTPPAPGRAGPEPQGDAAGNETGLVEIDMAADSAAEPDGPAPAEPQSQALSLLPTRQPRILKRWDPGAYRPEAGSLSHAPDTIPDDPHDETKRRADAEKRRVLASLEPRAGGRFHYRTPDGHIRVMIERDGSVRVNYGGYSVFKPPTLLPIEGLTRARVAKIMAQTREFRLQMAKKFRRERIQSQLHALRRQLARIWVDRNYDDRAKRRLIFELWRDTDDDPEPADEAPGDGPSPSETDAFRKEAAARARREIEVFIRKRFPANSDTAYTPTELEGMNRESAPRRFTPYR